MKVAVNKCWGGFGLSHKAIMRYAELAGMKLYPFIDTRDKDGRINFHKFTPYTGQKDVFCIHYSTKPLNSEGKYEDDTYWSYHDIERDNPLLIQVIEEMGAEANGDHANLVVVEVPDDVKYEIDEYDGQESIHEVHRSWQWACLLTRLALDGWYSRRPQALSTLQVLSSRRIWFSPTASKANVGLTKSP